MHEKSTRSATRLGLGILVVIAVAAALRLLTLSARSLWLDEFASWVFASRDLQGVLRSEPTNPPLYYLILHFWIGLFGSAEWALRSLSVVPSVASVWLVWRLGRRLCNREVALIAAVYQSVSTFQIYYAQEARCFSLLTSFLLIAAICLWSALNTGAPRQRCFWFAGYTISVALALYTHFITCFFVAGFGLFVLLRRRKNLIPSATATAIAVALFFPWLQQMLAAGRSGGQVRRYLMLKLPQAYFSFLYGDTLLPLDDEAASHIRETLVANWWILAAAAVFVAVLAPFGWRAVKRWGDGMLFVLTCCTAPVLLAFLVSFKIMLFDERYLIGASPFLYVAVAAAVWELWSFIRRREVSRAALAAASTACAAHCCLLLVSLFHYYFDPRYGKEEWRAAAAYIDSLAVGQKAILVYDPDYLWPCYTYYAKRSFPDLRLTGPVMAELQRLDGALADATRGVEAVLLVRSHDDGDEALNVMRRRFVEQSHRRFSTAKPIDVFAFRAR
jgi:uncharacterized membrane protein